MQGRGEKEKEREREIAVRRLVTRLAKVVSRTREKAVNDSTEGYLALLAARLDQQEAAQPVVTYPGISFYSPRMKRIRNTRNPIFARGLIIRGLKMGQFEPQYERIGGGGGGGSQRRKAKR